MFPRIVKTNKSYASYEYLVISESVRGKNGGSTTKNVATLGNVRNFSHEKVKGLIDGLIRLFEIEDYALTDQIEVLESLEHGSVVLWRALWRRMKLSGEIKSLLSKSESRIKIDVEKYIEIMVVNRCVNPLSKLGVTRWFDTTCYKMMKGYGDLNLDVEYFYRSMNYLLKIKEELELAMFQRLRNLFTINVRMTFYDITSTFFHTDSCPLSAHGHSRDMRPDKQQIVIGVVTSYEGYPIKHYVFEGNTKDEATVGEVLRDLRNDFNIEETTFVGDRGMISKLNLRKLEDEQFDYIMGVKHRQDEMVQMFFDENGLPEDEYVKHRDLKIQDRRIAVKDFILWKTKKMMRDNKLDCSETILSPLTDCVRALRNDSEVKYSDFRDALERLVPGDGDKIRRKIFALIKKYKNRYEDVVRVVVCLNDERKKIAKKRRDVKLRELSGELEKIFKNETAAPERVKKTHDVFDGHKKRFRKFFVWEKASDGETPVGFELDRMRIEDEEKYDGIFMLTTSRGENDLDAEKIVRSYKNLQEVEMLFDDLKHFVDVRPMRHWLEVRVRAHVFICVLALLLKRIFEVDCLKNKSTMEPLEIISKSKLVKHKIRFSEKEERSQVIPKVTTTTEEQKKIFDLVGIKNPMSLEDYAW